MRAYEIAIYMLSLNLALLLFVVVMNVSGSPSCDVEDAYLTNPGCRVLSYLPSGMRFIDQEGTIDTDTRTWEESIDYYAKYNYSEIVESEAEAQSSTWGNILKSMQVVIGIIKFGVFGVYIMVKAILLAAGAGSSTASVIAALFQSGTYAVYGIGLAQYIRGSGMKGYE